MIGHRPGHWSEAELKRILFYAREERRLRAAIRLPSYSREWKRLANFYARELRRLAAVAIEADR
jgi:hypothetical protein